MERFKAWLWKHEKGFENAMNILVGSLIVYFAVVSIGEGSWWGAFGCFYAMLAWAQAERYTGVYKKHYKEMSGLCDRALAVSTEMGEQNKKLLADNKELLSFLKADEHTVN